MPRNRLVLGDYNAECDRCRFKYKASELKKEWTGLMVCVHCWEPRHPQDFIRGVKEAEPLPWTRPVPVLTYISVTYSYGNGNNENTKPTGTSGCSQG